MTTHNRYHLTLGEHRGEPCFHLAGRPVPGGYGLELLVEPDHWIWGRFDTATDDDGQLQGLLSVLLPATPGGNEGTLIELRLPPAACLRWPDEA